MIDLALPTLAIVAALLLALGPVALVAGGKAGYWGALGLCSVGILTAFGFLLAGAPAAILDVPFGLAGAASTLALDGVSAVFLLLLMISGAAASAASLDDRAHPTAAAFPVFLGAMALTLLAADAFALVAGFELMSLASAILVVTHHRDPSVRAAAVLYLGMAAVAGVCLIAALALLASGGTSFAAMRARPPEGLRAALVLALALIGPGSKAGLVPLHVWLPPAHAAAPGPVSALMSGAMTKVALYVVVRLLFDLCGPAQPIWWALPLLAMGTMSAVLGSLRANLEVDVKTILACSTIENVGLITIGLGLAMAARAADLTALAGLALGAALLHAVAHGLFKTLLFLGAGAIQHATGTRLLSRLGGVLARMPLTGWGMLLGVACLAGLPPSAGFASEWMLFQAVLGAVRLGGLGLQIVVCVLAALVALATAMAACAAIRLAGVALLGRPRSPQATAAHEAGPPHRWSILALAVPLVLIGLAPGMVLRLFEPALRLLAGASLAGRAGLLAIAPGLDAPGYVPLGVIALLALAATGVAAVLRARAVPGHRSGPAWGGGFSATAFLAQGDPLTQYSGAGFAQPLRRVLATTLLSARAQLAMPQPGDTAAATYAEQATDPADAFLFAPFSLVRRHLSGLADRMQFLTVRQTLSVMVVVLVAFLFAIALMEQL